MGMGIRGKARVYAEKCKKPMGMGIRGKARVYAERCKKPMEVWNKRKSQSICRWVLKSLWKCGIRGKKQMNLLTGSKKPVEVWNKRKSQSICREV